MGNEQNARIGSIDPYRVAVVLGTRPEVIKLAPVIFALETNAAFEADVISTGQHREMLDQMLETFEVSPETDLEVMEASQSLSGLTAKLMDGLEEVLSDRQYDCVVVQGDTTTAFTAGLAAFYRQIPVAHVEAGLRTWRRYDPWPEEMNRRLLGDLANFHYAPTESAASNLLEEGVAEESVLVTGNTVVDATKWARDKVRSFSDGQQLFESEGISNDDLEKLRPILDKEHTLDAPLVALTLHRRENLLNHPEALFGAVRKIAEKYPDGDIVFPAHLNPAVRELTDAFFGDVPNILRVEPLPYLSFIALLERADIVLSDSGGIQEEALSVNTPVVVLRSSSERPEAIESGGAICAGTAKRGIVNYVTDLLASGIRYREMCEAQNPFGDGTAGTQIAQNLERSLRDH